TWGVTYWDYTDGSADVLFRQLDPTGAPLDEPKLVTAEPGDAFGAAMVWTGREYGAVWQDRRAGVWEIFFNRFTPDGEKLGPDVRLTFAPFWSINPSLAWTGSEFVVAWQDWRHQLEAPENFEVYMTFLDAEGFEIGDDIRLTSDPDSSEAPVLALGDEAIGVAFVDGRTGPEQVWMLVTSLTGDVLAGPFRVSASATDAYAPALIWAEDGWLVAWQEETPAGDFDVMGARVPWPGSAAAPVEGPFAVATGDAWARRPRLLFNGDSLLVGYSDDRSGAYDVWAALYDTRFGRLGEDIRVTRGPRDSVYGTLSRGGTSVGVLFEDQRDSNWEVYFTRLLCAEGALER
ncbi:MAG TPA: hypothetical protein RMI62_25495, partial [Polyangiaceae bacterium LLY-WYZ-15_(1-7)]|nr:hypothetical protein [Polyangiaceae bacterium LLY-WYZ-15_(1-7)]